MKKILSVAIVVIMIAALCATALAVEDYGAAIHDAWVKTNHVSRDEIRNGDDTGKYLCGADPAQTYDVTFPTGQTACIFWGWVAADETISGYGYTVNNGEMVKEESFFIAAEGGVVDHVAKSNLGPASARMKIKVPLTEGTQMVRCYVFYGDDAELIWQTKVVVGTSEGAAAKHGSCVDALKGIKGDKVKAFASTSACNFLEGAYEKVQIIGWYGANISMDAVGYKIDDGEAVFSGSMSAVADDDPVRAAANGGPKAMRIDIAADVAGLTDGDHTISYVAKLADASVIEMFKVAVKMGIDEDYKIMADNSGFGVGFWLGDSLPAGAYLEFDFGTPNYFSGFNTFIFATPVANGGCKATLQLFKDGVFLEEIALDCQGDAWQSGSFSKTYPAGTYTVRLIKVDGEAGKYIVLGDAAPDASKSVKLVKLGNSARDGYVPYFILKGAAPTTAPAFASADAALSSFDRIYVNTDNLSSGENSKDITMNAGDKINLLGWVWPAEGVAVEHVYYTVNDGKYIVAEDVLRPREDVDSAINKTGSTGIGLNENCLTLNGIEALASGMYTVKVYAYGSNTMYYMLTLNLKVGSPEKVGSYVDAANAGFAGENKAGFTTGDSFKIGDYDVIKVEGWYGSNFPIVQFGYKLNDGEAIFGDWATDVPDGDPVRDPANGGDLALRYNIPADISALEVGAFTITYVAKLADGSVLEVAAVEGTIESDVVVNPPLGSTTTIIVTAAVLAIGVAVVIGKKRIAE